MTNHRPGRLFNPAESHRLESPDRQRYMPTKELVSRLHIVPEMVIADIGAGTGYFALPMARAAATGKVYAVDLQLEMLDKLRVKLEADDAPSNIELVQGSAVQTNVGGHSCDLVLIANVWHELDDYQAALREVNRILKPNGRLAVLDWRPDGEHPPGPPLDHRVSMEQVCRTMASAGWICDSADHFGMYSYLVVAYSRG
jgi:ubiquinone/menaquinone biosynthesis C-methylase UbiE